MGNQPLWIPIFMGIGAAMAGSGGTTTVVEEPTTVVEEVPADYSSEDNGSEADE